MQDDVSITVNAAPTIFGPGGASGASSNVSISENSSLVYNFGASEAMTWSLAGGADQARFQIDPASGALSFISAPDFENPQDVGDGVGNNSYEVQIRAVDAAGNVRTQTVVISIADVVEPSEQAVVPPKPVIEPPTRVPETSVQTGSITSPSAAPTNTAEAATSPPEAAALASVAQTPVAASVDQASPGWSAAIWNNVQPSDSGRSAAIIAESHESPAPVPIQDVLTASGDRAFRIAVIKSNEDALMIFKGIRDQQFESRRLTDNFRFVVPNDAFAHTDPNAIIRQQAHQKNGEALPAWLSFDPVTGAFNGHPPTGYGDSLDIEVVAKDNAGREAKAVFRLHFKKVAGASSGFEGRMAFSDQLQQERRNSGNPGVADIHFQHLATQFPSSFQQGKHSA